MSIFFKGLPFTQISPICGSKDLRIRFAIVDLPEPDSPTKATFFPRGITKEIPSRTKLVADSEDFSPSYLSTLLG